MGRNLEPKCKQCRREGEKLQLKGEKCQTAKCPMVRRAYRPGVHGPTSRVRPTPYGVQLREKQKAKNSYGMMEKQFRHYFDQAKKKTGNTTDILVQLLEMRLDNVVFRLGLARSRALARQSVNHGHVLVNGKSVTIPSYQVKEGDIISLSTKAKARPSLQIELAKLEQHLTPSWLYLDIQELTGKVLHAPKDEDLKQNFNPQLIVEYYSR
ncbi:30S ribosomal protein S4 [Candidatus Uhrbacteria bacterium RIFOXYC2_FULL_47_19]|uniref:Small ribosomal subunit protein uS4 n=1 Tax=Candidatus Uhrbacteria bacterium RIFOXYC2_FULL_47_19 TaxID=1802424 RepID=A0A1F7WF73_9BACT|nr:MAG: 30S ribosomal protein S4 [Candidatus Uhrbacteria bacterium RIFOXYC2_FULL_47_19]